MTESNAQATLARRVIETTDTHLFLTGKAGTGKTTFLRRLCADCPKRMVVLAPTGIAAINAGGMTIHSFFQLPFSPFVPGNSSIDHNLNKLTAVKRKLINSIDLLIIDEISMVRADLLDAVDYALRRIRHSSRPFGGVQLLLIGDLQQLSPVVKDDEWRMISRYYDKPYFFSSHALKSADYITIELEKVYRQSDSHFLSLLAGVRSGDRSARLLDELNKRYLPHVPPEARKGCIQLVTHNRMAQAVNSEELDRLPARAYHYRAEIEGNFPEASYPTDATLTLKEGAQVMFVKNDPGKRYVNGTIGHICRIDNEGFTVQTEGADPQRIEVTPEAWENTRYGIDEKTKEISEITDGKFSQYPVKPAWAITIHKSQGLTFDRVLIDAASSFAHGQTYVALSRCRTLEGIILTSPIPPQAIISDPSISRFNSEMPLHSVDEQRLSGLQQAYALHLLTELFTFDKERIAMASLVRLFEEHLSRMYPTTLSHLRDALRTFDLEVMGVAGRFHLQYEQMVHAGGGHLSAPALQERIKKGAAYFAQRLQTVTALSEALPAEVDNKEVKRRLDEARTSLTVSAKVHLMLLKHAAEHGFEAKPYLQNRAKFLLEVEGEKKRRGKTAHTAAASTAGRQSKPAAPLEVENVRLYQRLQKWRREKAESRGVPAFVVFPNTTLIEIANHAPHNKLQFLALKGCGRKKYADYGEEVLSIVLLSDQ